MAKAEENYQAALQIDKEFFPSAINLVLLYSRSGRSKQAEQLLRRLVREQPEIPDVYYYLGLILAENKKYDESIVYLKKAAKQTPKQARVFYNLAMLYDFLGEKKKAETNLHKARALEPANLKYLYAALQFYLQNQNPAAARETAKEILRRYPEHPEKEQLLKFLQTK
jgi:tetratricopeptide (TPR) repeat protein